MAQKATGKRICQFPWQRIHRKSKGLGSERNITMVTHLKHTHTEAGMGHLLLVNNITVTTESLFQLLSQADLETVITNNNPCMFALAKQCYQYA